MKKDFEATRGRRGAKNDKKAAIRSQRELRNKNARASQPCWVDLEASKGPRRDPEEHLKGAQESSKTFSRPPSDRKR